MTNGLIFVFLLTIIFAGLLLFCTIGLIFCKIMQYCRNPFSGNCKIIKINGVLLRLAFGGRKHLLFMGKDKQIN